jgi:hypothetical protein
VTQITLKKQRSPTTTMMFLAFGPVLAFFAIRVLANDWYLLSVEEKVVDFHFIYKHVLAY